MLKLIIILMEMIFFFLNKIGLRSNYTGFYYLATAIELTLNNPQYLRNVTKNLYVEIGDIYGVTNRCVEAALRTLITSYWNQYEDKILSRLLGYPLYDKPTASEFISLMTECVREHCHYRFKRMAK